MAYCHTARIEIQDPAALAPDAVITMLPKTPSVGTSLRWGRVDWSPAGEGFRRRAPANIGNSHRSVYTISFRGNLIPGDP